MNLKLNRVLPIITLVAICIFAVIVVFQERAESELNINSTAEFHVGERYDVPGIGLDFQGPFIAEADSQPTFIFPIIKADNVSLQKQVPFVLVVTKDGREMSSTIGFTNVQRSRILTSGSLHFGKLAEQNKPKTSIDIKHTIGLSFDRNYDETMEYCDPQMKADVFHGFDLAKGRVFDISFDRSTGKSIISQHSADMFPPSIVSSGDANKINEALLAWWATGQSGGSDKGSGLFD